MKIEYNRETGKDSPRDLIVEYVVIVGPSRLYILQEVIVQEEKMQIKASRQLMWNQSNSR